MAQEPRNPADNGQPQSGAGLVPPAPRETGEFGEDQLLLIDGDAPAGVMDLDAEPVAHPSRAHQDPAVIRVTDGVADQVLQQGPQQIPVRSRPQTRCGSDVQGQPLRSRQRRELAAQVGEQALQRQRRDRGADPSSFQSGEVEQRFQQTVGALDRPVRIVGQNTRARPAAGVGLVLEGGDKQAGCMQRLEQVVARCGQEAGLGG